MAQLTDLEKVRRRRERRRVVRGLVTLAIFAAVVAGCIFVVRQAGELDIKTAYGDIKAGLSTGDGYPVTLPGGQLLRLDSFGDSLALLTDTNLYTYNESGRQMASVQHGMVNPMVASAGGRLLLYDRGANRVDMLSRSGVTNSLTAPYMIYAADLAANGNFAVATGADKALAKVTVYNKNFQEIFGWLSDDRPVISVSLAENENEILVGCVNVENGSYKSSIQKFQLSYGESDVGSAEFVGELLLSVDYRSGSAVRVITDQRAVLLDGGLREVGSVSFGGGPIDSFADGPDGRLTLVLGDYAKDKKLTVVTLDASFTELGRFTIDHNLSAVKLDAKQLYIMDQEQVEVYRFSGEKIATAPLANPHYIALSGGKLYCATNLSLEALDIKTLTEPPETSSGASGQSSETNGSSEQPNSSEAEPSSAASAAEESAPSQTSSAEPESSN